jgi:trigger factor
LDYQISSGEDWHNVISVTFPAVVVKPELDAKYAELKNIRLEGFRKGKVPPQLAKKMYGKQVEADVFRPFIAKAYETIFKENEFDLLDSPELQNLLFDEEKGLTFEFQFDVRPVIKVNHYKGLPIERVVFDVTDEDVAQTLENMRRQNAMVYSVEGGAQIGHFLIADLHELDISGVPILGSRIDDQVLELKAGEEITAQLLGIKAGEERRVQVSIEHPVEPQMLQTPQVKQIFYSVSVKEIKERRLPNLDDEFAKDMGEFESLDVLKKELLMRLNMQAQSDSARHFRQALEDELIKRHPMQAPRSMTENYLKAVVEDARKREKSGVDEDKIRATYTPVVIRNIRWIILREQLIKDHSITITDEELEARLTAIAAGGKQGETRAQELRNNKEALQRLKDAMEEEKVYDLLTRESEVTEIHQPWHKHQHDDPDKGEEITDTEE